MSSELDTDVQIRSQNSDYKAENTSKLDYIKTPETVIPSNTLTLSTIDETDKKDQSDQGMAEVTPSPKLKKSPPHDKKGR